MGGPTRIFFAADLHGSELTFRKFLSAASFYDVDALVFGGDLMGKAFVPIVREGEQYLAEFRGERHEVGGDGLAAFTGLVERTGFYWQVMDRDAYDAANTDPLLQHALFKEAARARLASWI